MEINYIQLAIPVFFVAILLEVVYSGIARKGWYDLHDSLSNLACGSIEQLAELLYKTALLGIYILLYGHLRTVSLPLDSIAVWVVCFILVDLGYYCFHRASHRVHIIWAGHGPHHQSEEYNLTVALRQGALERCWSWLFWLPLAILGFPPLMYVACVQFNNIYQFFVHTRAVDRLGPLELVLNTPSHHRVHHGKNPAYIDKNYGGVLIVWDRLFGTFAAEVEPPVYGTVKPLHSWNPLWANAVFYADMGNYMRGLTLGQKIQVLLRPPGWRPEQPVPEIPAVTAASYPKYRTSGTLGRNLLLGLHFIVVLQSATLFLPLAHQLPASLALLAGSCLTAGFVAILALIESRSWFWRLESLRLPLTLLTLWLLPLVLPWQLAGTAAVLALSLGSLWLSGLPGQHGGKHDKAPGFRPGAEAEGLTPASGPSPPPA